MAEIIPGNPSGDVQLVTSITLKATATGGTQHDIGTAININPSERRDVTYNFVIGNSTPDEARDLIPGPVRDSTLTVDYVALYKAGVTAAFGRQNAANVLDAFMSIREQNRPFEVVETIKNPATGDTIQTTYSGCYIADYRATRDISRGDIRILETVTINFRTVSSTATPGS